MRTELDQIAKQVLLGGLEDAGQTTLEQYVAAPDPQHIDLWHVPGPRPEAPRWLALLYRMTERACLLEPSSAPPRVGQLRGNQREQLVWHHHLVLEARRQGTEAPELPYLWLVSPGRPEGLFSAFPLQALHGWPEGFYALLGSWEIGLLVVPELPPGVETVVLRLLGGDRSRREALREIGALGDSEEGWALRRFVTESRQSVARDKEIAAEQREAFMTAARAEFLKYEQDLIEKGIEKGMREGVRVLCEALGIEVDEARSSHIEGLDAGGLRALLAQIKLQRRWPD